MKLNKEKFVDALIQLTEPSIGKKREWLTLYNKKTCGYWNGIVSNNFVTFEDPTFQPVTDPTTSPSTVPTTQPTTIPTTQPTTDPSSSPTTLPSTVKSFLSEKFEQTFFF